MCRVILKHLVPWQPWDAALNLSKARSTLVIHTQGEDYLPWGEKEEGRGSSMVMLGVLKSYFSETALTAAPVELVFAQYKQKGRLRNRRNLKMHIEGLAIMQSHSFFCSRKLVIRREDQSCPS